MGVHTHTHRPPHTAAATIGAARAGRNASVCLHTKSASGDVPGHVARSAWKSGNVVASNAALTVASDCFRQENPKAVNVLQQALGVYWWLIRHVLMVLRVVAQVDAWVPGQRHQQSPAGGGRLQIKTAHTFRLFKRRCHALTSTAHFQVRLQHVGTHGLKIHRVVPQCEKLGRVAARSR